MTDYFKIDSARKYARTLADQSKLAVRFHDQPLKFYTDGQTINVPDPTLVATDLDIWMYGLIHEIQHNSPEYRGFMHLFKCQHRHALNNVLCDYQHEAGLFGYYTGKDRIMQSGREKFLAGNPEVPPKNDFELLMASLYRACDIMRSQEWPMFNPALTKNPQVISTCNDILSNFGNRIQNSVSHSTTEHKQLIEDLIQKYVKDKSAPETEQEGEQAAAAAAAAGQAAIEALEQAIADAMQQAKGIDTHGKPAKTKQSKTLEVYHPGSSTGYGNAEISKWNVRRQNNVNTPNISEQVRKLLLAKKLKNFENNKKQGKFRAAGITKLFNHDLNVFSKKTQALSYNTDVVVCVDVSGSMAGPKICAARDACSGFVNVLQDLQANYGVLLYESDLYWLKTPDQHMNKGEVESKVSTITECGGTMTNHALVEAAHALSASQNKAIILLTDGDADDQVPGQPPHMGRGATPHLIKNLEKHGYRVYTVIIEQKHMYNEFKKSGVNVCFVNNSSELPAAMMGIVQDIYVR